ncbi:hypothetical protein [Candidatus Thiodictyon syntrophicum]|jgi:hypothetical protein|uniref:Uncharacterized protein n=1 Tax=Candidatus Thiodictyon syntrophicum TaxID=1166950 RepID=A0A2K8U7Q5_9GAMM|nr:hypothetical protein [Candidatus Thiodictyon syntrophicum]AUB81449.1 hypothetical protein THSYN_11120 [Candidatus Thiodictyon syntrophicum]
MDELCHCDVIRLPGAPPWRAGRAWPLGLTAAFLTPEQVRVLGEDPGYSVSDWDPGPAAATPAQSPAAAALRRKRSA